KMPRFRMVAMLVVACATLLQAAGPSEREVAEWIIRQGGSVIAEGRLGPIGALKDLPTGDLRIQGINLVGTLVEATELKRFSALTALRELALPAPMWTPGAGSRLDANGEFQSLANLTSLEKLTFSLHFLTNINVQDKGLEHLAKLTKIQELRL